MQKLCGCFSNSEVLGINIRDELHVCSAQWFLRIDMEVEDESHNEKEGVLTHSEETL